MALQDLYGINKGEAQIFDNRPILNLLAEERDANRKAYATSTAKKATKIAAIDALDDKLNNEGWTNHNEAIQGNLDEIHKYAQEQYAENGTSVFYDNPEKLAEFKSKIDEFKSLNQWSKNMKASAQKNLERSKGNAEDLDLQSLGEFNSWLDLSAAEQRMTPMPIIKDRNRSSLEIMRDDYSDKYAKMSKEIGYSTKPGEDGRYNHISGQETDIDKVNSLNESLVTNIDIPYYRAVMREATQSVLGAKEISQYTVDEQGNKVENKLFLDEVNRVAREVTKDNSDNFTSPEFKKSKAAYTPGSGTKEERELEVIEINEAEAGKQVGKRISGLDKSEAISSIAQDKSGKYYYKIKAPVIIDDKGVRLATPEEIVAKDDRIIPIDSWTDAKGNIKTDLDDLTESKKYTTSKTTESYRINNSETKSVSSKEYIQDGKKVRLPSDVHLNDVKVVKLESLDANETDKGYTFSGDKGYNADNAKEITIVSLKTKKGDIYEVPVTEEIKSQFPKAFKKINEARKSKIAKLKFNTQEEKYIEANMKANPNLSREEVIVKIGYNK